MRPDSGHELTFGVLGLTKDNQTRAKESLRELSVRIYTCKACDLTEQEPGNCPKCKAALQPESHPIFSSVQSSAEAGTISLTLGPKAMLRYSELESALAGSQVRIDPAHFTLPGRARLVVQGTADAAPAVEKALTDAKLFEDVKAHFDTAKNELLVNVHAGTNPPTREKVMAALEGTKVRLTDILWGGHTPRT